MFAKTLINLIDYAIFPAVLIVSAKIIGVVFFAKYFSVNYTVEGTRLVFSNIDNFTAVNSYSSLFMYFAVVAGLLWVIIKAHVFHDTHVVPSFSAMLFGMNLEELIQTTKTIFSQSFIWLSYAWILTIIFGIHSYFNLSYWWVFYIALGATVILTAILVIDIEREILSDKDLTKAGIIPKSRKKTIKFEQLKGTILG